MRRVQRAAGAAAAFLLLPGIAWLICSWQQDISWSAAIPIAAALMVESALYLTAGVRKLRSWLGVLSAPRLAALLVITAVVTHVLAGAGDPVRTLLLAGVAAAVAFWYVLLPPKLLVDAGFVILVASVSLAKVFADLYPRPFPKLPLDVLGEIMLARTGALAVLLIRRLDGIGEGFLPTRAEWWIGLRHFLYFAPVGLALSLLVDFARPRTVSSDWTRVLVAVAGTFLGNMLFVAFREEFFFRGVLQQRLSHSFSPAGALVTVSVLFGLAHLTFREFPNWRFAVVASAAGWFYGRAYQQAGSIRAAMVTHSLVNTLWRVFFTG